MVNKKNQNGKHMSYDINELLVPYIIKQPSKDKNEMTALS